MACSSVCLRSLTPKVKHFHILPRRVVSVWEEGLVGHPNGGQSFSQGTFLDIEGAFDNVSYKAISEAIDQSPLDSATAGWIKDMVTNRHVTITHKNATRLIKTKRGCPQVGVLSPFLWNLVIDDLLQYTAKHIPGYIQAFADDIMSLAEGDDLDVIWQRTQTAIKTIENWYQSKGLNISALKTKIR